MSISLLALRCERQHLNSCLCELISPQQIEKATRIGRVRLLLVMPHLPWDNKGNSQSSGMSTLGILKILFYPVLLFGIQWPFFLPPPSLCLWYKNICWHIVLHLSNCCGKSLLKSTFSCLSALKYSKFTILVYSIYIPYTMLLCHT